MSAAKKLKHIDLNDDLAQEIAACVQSVFKGTFGIEVRLRDFHIGKDHIAVADVSAIIGMVQQDKEGDLILSFSQPVIFDILQRVYQKNFDKIDEVVTQGAAEMANMIYGQLKRKMNERGHDLKMALPSCISGPIEPAISSDDSFHLFVTFQYDKDKHFKVFIALKNQ